MGKLERKCFRRFQQFNSIGYSNAMLQTVGCLPLHAMRVASPEDGNAYLKGQIIDYGQLDNRTSGGKKQPRQQVQHWTHA